MKSRSRELRINVFQVLSWLLIGTLYLILAGKLTEFITAINSPVNQWTVEILTKVWTTIGLIIIQFVFFVVYWRLIWIAYKKDIVIDLYKEERDLTVENN